MCRIRFLGLVLVAGVQVFGAQLAPFVIPLEMNPQSPLLFSSSSLKESDRLFAREHFVTADGRRIRLWGVNLSFAACLPSHQDAQKVARRMAEFGVNVVRLHHLDTSTWPSGIWNENGKGLHPEALDRLDYFIDQLAQRGIYTNLNLHVGREHSRFLGLPQADESYDKMVSIFMPQLIEAQKEYARALLTRKNAYRQMTYAQDYAVAITEITNENSLFMWSADRVLPTLPEVYAEQLRRLFNTWLKDRYGTTEQLAKAWTKESEPLGRPMLRNADFSEFDPQQAAPAEWVLEQHSGCQAELQTAVFNGRRALVIQPKRISGTDWHLQFNQRSLAVRAGQSYTLQLAAAAQQPCRVTLSVGMAHEPWANLGLWKHIELKPEWQNLTLTFTAPQSDTNARVSISFGNCQTPFALWRISLRPGVQYELEPGESLEEATVGVFANIESQRRRLDRMMFLAETEKAYFDQMYRFIKEDLNFRGMVTGTIVFGPLGLYAQSDMDFIDSHAYWQHPRFPRRPWDPGDWLIDQKAMSDYPDEATLLRLAAERMAGKPFTVSEYNHPAPLDSQAECVPMIASFAAAQDWDGVWLYTYSHSNNAWNREHLNSFFDIDTNPSKWGFMPAGAKLFREALLGPLMPWQTDISTMSVETLAKLHMKAGSNMPAALGPDVKEHVMGVAKPLGPKIMMRWDVVNGKGLYAIGNDRCRVLTGKTERFGSITEDFTVHLEQPEFAAVVVTSWDGKPLTTSCRKLLVTACGRCENTGMQFSEDRRTVGRQWGTAPVRIEPVVGSLQFAPDSPFYDAEVVCHLLNADGSIRSTVPVVDGRVRLDATHGTMWYLIERKTP